MKKLILVLVAVFVLSVQTLPVLASGFLSPGKSQSVENPRTLADQLLGRVFQAYQNFSRPTFEDLVAEDFRPLRSEFITNADRRAHDGKVLEMHYVLNEVWVKKNKLIAAFSWEKKTYPVGASEPVLSRGEARGVFVLQQDVWKLSLMSGNNPF